MQAASIYAQAPEFSWVKVTGDDTLHEGMVYPSGVELNLTNGTIYTAGIFSGRIDFDPGPAELILETEGEGGYETYFMKWDQDGNVAWVKAFSSSLESHFRDIKYDESVDALYISGSFVGNTDFDPGGGVYNLGDYPGSQAYVCKLDGEGNFSWAFSIPTSIFAGAAAIDIDEAGAIYITGSFFDTVDFDPGPATFNLTSNGGMDIFIAKYSGTAQLQWAVSIGSEYNGEDSEEYGLSITIGNSRTKGNVVCVTGEFDGGADFDPGPGTYFLYPSTISAFVVQLDGDGNFEWACQFTNAINWNGGYSIDFDPDNLRVLVTGYFGGPTDFDPGPADFILSPVGANDMFIVALSDIGDLVWAKSVGGLEHDIGLALKVDLTPQRHILITGMHSDMADFDTGPGVYEVAASGLQDAFVLKLDNTGQFIWVKAAGGIDTDAGQAVAVNSSSRVFVVGAYNSPVITFDSADYTNPNPLTFDGFLTRIGSCPDIVNNNYDSGFRSLRDLIGCAGEGDTITFELPPMSEIVLTSGEILITKDLTLIGPGIVDLTISGNNASRIFNLATNTEFNIEGMSLKNAAASTNGGAILTHGHLHMRDVVLDNNYQSGIPKSLTLKSTGSLHIDQLVQMKY